MKFTTNIIVSFTHKIICLVMVFNLLVQPVFQAYNMLSKSDYELIEFDYEEIENKTKDSKQFETINYLIIETEETTTYFEYVIHLHSNFIIEIPIPPPNTTEV